MSALSLWTLSNGLELSLADINFLATMFGLVEALLKEALIDADVVSLGREKRVLEIALLSQTIHAYS